MTHTPTPVLTEHEQDVADVVDWVHATHRPDEHMVCTACGQQWWVDPNTGLVQCQTYLDARIEANFSIMRRVWRLRAKWRTA